MKSPMGPPEGFSLAAGDNLHFVTPLTRARYAGRSPAELIGVTPTDGGCGRKHCKSPGDKAQKMPQYHC